MRRALAALASFGLGIGTIALATPAHADSFSPDCTAAVTNNVSGNSHTFTVSGNCNRVTWSVTESPASGLSASDISVTANGGSVADSDSGPPTTVASNDEVAFSYNGSPSGTLVLSFFDENVVPQSTSLVKYVITVTGGGGGGGDDSGSSAPASAAPAVVDVTLDQITSEVLRTWASTATLGSWKQLPESTEITGVDENAGKTFLGAATTPDFPVDIAQRQVDNGWGAYQTFNEDGDLTAVFIPAGGWMHITNSTRLYAIWSE